jgi:RNA 3'-terminal phosphate cyclase (ATP)
MLTIDGSMGEGGGQILRTSLAFSLVTGTPFRIENIRAGRKKPGLMRQHLTAVKATAEIGHAEVVGARVGSLELTFAPGRVVPGEYSFSVGTAGSTTLVLQTILPALLTAAGPSSLVLDGGTHNPFAPPFDFLQKTFLPIVNRMGPTVIATLERPGFFPTGGGRLIVAVEPSRTLAPIDLLDRGPIQRRLAKAVVAGLPRHIAEREVRTIARVLRWPDECLCVEELSGLYGPGNVVTVEIESAHITEVCTGFGQKGVRAEIVAEGVAKEARRYLDANVPVGEHLADQLLIPFALAGGGSYKTGPLSRHAHTNIDVVKMFLDIEIAVEETRGGQWLVELRKSGQMTSA